MTQDKKSNLQCTKCRKQEECSKIEDSLSEMRCGLTGGHLDDSCKVNLQLDGKAVFELTQVIGKPKEIPEPVIAEEPEPTPEPEAPIEPEITEESESPKVAEKNKKSDAKKE